MIAVRLWIRVPKVNKYTNFPTLVSSAAVTGCVEIRVILRHAIIITSADTCIKLHVCGVNFFFFLYLTKMLFAVFQTFYVVTVKEFDPVLM
jgi:hypothetical protein